MTNTKGRACTGKQGYTRKIDALGAAVYRQRKFGATRDATNVYQCDFCGLYHVGHRPRQAKHR